MVLYIPDAFQNAPRLLKKKLAVSVMGRMSVFLSALLAEEKDNWRNVVPGSLPVCLSRSLRGSINGGNKALLLVDFRMHQYLLQIKEECCCHEKDVFASPPRKTRTLLATNFN
jgi:hypothetical protein